MQITIPKSLVTRLSFAFFVIAVVLLISYQLAFVIFPQGTPFIEPDGLEYYLYAQLAVAHHTLAPVNPYLVNLPNAAFFEHVGLFEAPVILHWALPFIPLAWDFRIIYLVVVALIYILSLLIVREILQATPLARSYRYLAYALVVLNYLLMLQTQAFGEYRGNTFITLIMLAMTYILARAWLPPAKHWSIKVYAVLVCLGLLSVAAYMWSGWMIAMLPLLLVPIFLVYDKVKGDKLYWVMALGAFILAVVLFLFATQLEAAITYILHSVPGIPVLKGVGCSNNPLQIGEVDCINFSNGLYTILLYVLFFAFAIRIYLSRNIFASGKDKYGHLLIAVFAMTLLVLPFALIYVRILQIAAPYLAIGFSVAVVGIIARSGASRWVMAFVLTLIFVSSAFAFIIYAQTIYELYTLDNPVGLITLAQHLNATGQNQTVLAYWEWGGILEINHQQVYTDTIQESNVNSIIAMDSFYSSDPVNCSYLSDMKLDYVITSNTLYDVQLFANASANSLVGQPLGLVYCNYTLVDVADNFYLFKSSPTP